MAAVGIFSLKSVSLYPAENTEPPFDTDERILQWGKAIGPSEVFHSTRSIPNNSICSGVIALQMVSTVTSVPTVAVLDPTVDADSVGSTESALVTRINPIR